MLTFNQNRSHSLEQSLKKAMQMAELNLSSDRSFYLECEACDCNETYLISNYKVND